MTPGRPWGARLALWWVAVYTATAPPEDAEDRRAEVAADVADELRCSGMSAAASRRMAGRVLRGVAADVLWRLSVERAPGRAAWHLEHPTTVIGTLTGLLLPLVLVGDVLRSLSGGSAGRLLDLVHAGVVLSSAAVLAVAITVVIRRLAEGPRGRQDRGALLRARRGVGLGVCVLWAAAALWRFTPGPWEGLAAGAWAAFAVCLLVWLVLSGVVAVATRRQRARRH